MRVTHLAVAAVALSVACGGFLGIDEDADSTSGGGGTSDDGSVRNADGGSDGAARAPFCAGIVAAKCWDWDEGQGLSDGWGSFKSNGGQGTVSSDASTSPPSSAYLSTFSEGNDAMLLLDVPAGSDAVDITFSARVPENIPASATLLTIGLPDAEIQTPSLVLSIDESQVGLEEQGAGAGSASYPGGDPLPHDRFVRIHVRVQIDVPHLTFDVDGVNRVDSGLVGGWDKSIAHTFELGVRQTNSSILPGQVSLFLDDVVVSFQ